MRDIKFRAWNSKKGMFFFTLSEVINHQKNFQVLIDYPKLPMMQYAGLKDKNGEDVYEGDLYTMSPFDEKSKQYEVRWEHSGFHLPNSEAMEVVGNIWES